MKKFFQSKGFIVTSLAVLCVAILGVCWFASRDRTEDFKPEESPQQHDQRLVGWRHTDRR